MATQRKRYAFAAATEEEEEEDDRQNQSPPSPPRRRRSSSKGDLYNDDEEDTFVTRFFAKNKPPTVKLTRAAADAPPAPASKRKPISSSSSASFAQPKRKFRAKPDLTSDEEDDDDTATTSHFTSLTKPTSKASQIHRREREAERRTEKLALARERDRQQQLDLVKLDKRLAEEARLKQRFWIGQVLEGSTRSQDDRGGRRGGKLVLRRDTVKESAREYAHGHRVFQSSILHQQGAGAAGASAGRFYLEPQAHKKTERNADETVLYLVVEQCGAEGLTVRVQQRHYEVFEGDVVLVPEGAVYALVNPSRSKSATVLYMLLGGGGGGAHQEEEEEEAHQQDEDEEDVLEFDFAPKGQDPAGAAAAPGLVPQSQSQPSAEEDNN